MNSRSPLQKFPLLRLLPLFIAGIFVGDALAATLSPWWWLAGATVLIGSFFLVRHTSFMVQSLLPCGGLLLLGAALSSYEWRVTKPIPALSASADSVRHWVPARDYEAIVVSQSTVKSNRISCDLLVTRLDGRLLDSPFKLRATQWCDSLSPSSFPDIGSGVRALSALTWPVKKKGGNYSFDYGRYLHAHGYRAQTWLRSGGLVPTNVDARHVGRLTRLRIRALRYRAQLLQRYQSSGLEGDELAVVAAMTLGDKTGLSAQLKDHYAQTGVSHVLALSGLHISIIHALLSLLLHGDIRWRRAGEVAIVAIIWGYAFVAGLPTSLVRATTMLTVVSVCRLFGRYGVALNTLAFAALLMLACRPSALWDVGFQLSFSAVFAILIFCGPLSRIWRPRLWVVRLVWSMLMVTVAAQIGTAPLVAYHFGRLPVYFLLTNLIVVPAAWLLVCGSLLLLIVSPIPVAAQGLAAALSTLVHAVNSTLSTMSSWPGASIDIPPFSALQLAMVYLLVAVLSLIVFRLSRAMQRAKTYRYIGGADW